MTYKYFILPKNVNCSSPAIPAVPQLLGLHYMYLRCWGSSLPSDWLMCKATIDFYTACFNLFSSACWKPHSQPLCNVTFCLHVVSSVLDGLFFLNLHLSVFQFLKHVILFYGAMRPWSLQLFTCVHLSPLHLSSQVIPTGILNYLWDHIRCISLLVSIKFFCFTLVFLKSHI